MTELVQRWRNLSMSMFDLLRAAPLEELEDLAEEVAGSEREEEFEDSREE